jgi:hypothetical protein
VTVSSSTEDSHDILSISKQYSGFYRNKILDFGRNRLCGSIGNCSSTVRCLVVMISSRRNESFHAAGSLCRYCRAAGIVFLRHELQLLIRLN